jgi:hypothetical protein
VDDLNVGLGDCAGGGVRAEEAGQAVVRPQREAEASAVLVEPRLAPALGHCGVADGVDLLDGLGADRFEEFPLAGLREQVGGRLAVGGWDVGGWVELAQGGSEGFAAVVLDGPGL